MKNTASLTTKKGKKSTIRLKEQAIWYPCLHSFGYHAIKMFEVESSYIYNTKLFHFYAYSEIRYMNAGFPMNEILVHSVADAI